jgi:hypothetical protein
VIHARLDDRAPKPASTVAVGDIDAPDARAVLLGSGDFYEGTALTNAGSLPVQIVDAAWTGQNLYTIRVVAGVTVLQQWNTNNYSQAAYRQLSGAPLRVFAGADGVTVVTLQDSAPRFHLLDQSLTPVFSSPVRPSVPGSLTAVRVGAETVTLSWTDLSDNEDTYEVEQQLPDPVGWKRLTSLAAGTVRYEVTGLAFSSTNGFRVRAVNGSGDSAYAGPLVVVTLPDPRNPMPAIGPQIVEALATRVEIGWEDASSNEDGFRIERRDLGDTGSWKIAGTVPTDSTRFVDAGVGAGRRYEYRVVAFNAFSAAPPTACDAAACIPYVISAAGPPPFPRARRAVASASAAASPSPKLESIASASAASR